MKFDIKIIIAYIKKFVKDFIAKFKKPNVEKPVEPPIKPVEPVPVIPPVQENPFAQYKGMRAEDLIINVLHRGFIGDEEKQARDAGVIFKDTAPVGPVEPAPPSGAYNDISNGSPKIFQLADGQVQSVIYNRSGTVRVYGASGTQIRSLTDKDGERKLTGSVAWYDAPQVGAGTYEFSVTSTGNNIAVMFF